MTEAAAQPTTTSFPPIMTSSETPSRLAPLRCAVLSVSDAATEATDRCGSYLRARLERAGHEVVFHDVLPDQPAQIGPVLDALTQQADVVLINGGTGLTSGDRAIDVVSSRLDKRLSGFGELLRTMAFEETGASAWRLRALAGVYRRTVVFVCPDDLPLLRQATDRLILPELKAAVRAVTPQPAS